MSDRWIQPMKPEAIELAKQRFLSEVGPLEKCTCSDCSVQRANKCQLQFDVYNTDGDCLLEK